MYRQVSVVVVTYNNQTTIKAVLDGLEQQADGVLNRVVVVDNGSRDGTADAVNALLDSYSFSLTFVQSANIGFAAGVLAGAQHLDDPSLPTLCLNPDLVLAPGTVEAMLKVLNTRSNAGIVTAPLITSDGMPDSASVRKLPRLGTAAVYAALGKFTPRTLRYNGHSGSVSPAEQGSATPIEATTGALMLVHPLFRRSSQGIFDTDYWMYGEDLQLCSNAAAEGWKVFMTSVAPSLHLKGVSSGWPRSLKSNIAFHRAMHQYYRKNLAGSAALTAIVFVAVNARLLLSIGLGAGDKVRSLIARSGAPRESFGHSNNAV